MTTVRLEVDRCLTWLKGKDRHLVSLIVASAGGPFGRHSAIAISRLGDGWFYPVYGLVAVMVLRHQGPLIAGPAGLSVALSHAVYPWIKKRTRRPRPFRADATLTSLLPVRDEYSFPSGHTMTLTASVVPIAYAVPHACIPGVTVVALMAWARVASAHHYVSDVCAGILIGLAIALPVTAMLSP